MVEWQQDIMDKMFSDPAPGELKVVTSARRSGKSELAEVYADLYEQLIAEKRMQSDTRKRLLSEGWLPVECSKHFHNNWPECHKQCAEMFGKDNYTWTGEIFWFRTEEDILWFRMAFGA
jgi:hypothetical protein